MPTIYFESCRFEPHSNELWVGLERVSLQPLVGRVLACLLDARGATVSHQVLLAQGRKSTVLSESVVARSVMKVRKALQGDAKAQDCLQTVAKLGYRYTGHVTRTDSTTPGDAALAIVPVTAPNHAYQWVLLPLKLAEGASDPGRFAAADLNWWLWFALSRRCGPEVLLLEDTPLSRGDVLAHADRFEEACRVLGAQRAAEVSIQREGAAWVAHIGFGSSEQFAERLCIRANELNSLLVDVVGALAGPEANLPAWPEFDRVAAGELLSLHAARASGDRQECLRQALQWRARWGYSPMLAVACLRWRLAPLSALTGVLSADESGQPVGEPLSPEWQAWLALAHAQALQAESQLPEAEKAFEAVEVLAIDQPRLVPVWVSALMELASSRRRARHPDALRTAERALMAAITSSCLLIEAQARLQFAKLLVLTEQTPRHPQAVTRACELASRCHAPQLELQAVELLVLSFWSNRRWRDARNLVRRMAALAKALGDVPLMDSARTSEFVCLVQSNDLDGAMGHPFASIDPETLPAGARVAVMIQQARLFWRCNQAERALSRVDAAIQLQDRHGKLHLLACYALRASVLSARGQHAEASLAADAAQSLVAPEHLALPLIQANLRVARGENPAALELLWERLPDALGRSHDAIDLCLALAWLLLEQPEHPRRAELDLVVSHVIDEPQDYCSARMLRCAYLLAKAPSAQTRLAWDQFVAQFPALLSMAPWLATSAYRESIAQARPHPPLPLLVVDFCG